MSHVRILFKRSLEFPFVEKEPTTFDLSRIFTFRTYGRFQGQHRLFYARPCNLSRLRASSSIQRVKKRTFERSNGKKFRLGRVTILPSSSRPGIPSSKVNKGSVAPFETRFFRSVERNPGESKPDTVPRNSFVAVTGKLKKSLVESRAVHSPAWNPIALIASGTVGFLSGTNTRCIARRRSPSKIRSCSFRFAFSLFFFQRRIGPVSRRSKVKTSPDP